MLIVIMIFQKEKKTETTTTTKKQIQTKNIFSCINDDDDSEFSVNGTHPEWISSLIFSYCTKLKLIHSLSSRSYHSYSRPKQLIKIKSDKACRFLHQWLCTSVFKSVKTNYKIHIQIRMNIYLVLLFTTVQIWIIFISQLFVTEIREKIQKKKKNRMK